MTVASTILLPGRRVFAPVMAALALLVFGVGCTNDGGGISGWTVQGGGTSIPDDGRYTVTTPLPLSPEEVAGTVVPPDELDELEPMLLAPSEVGVPDTWAILDLDPLVASDKLNAPDADLLRGLGECEGGGILLPRPVDRPWISRRYTSPDEPIDEGLVQVEVLTERLTGDGVLQLEQERVRWQGCELREGVTANVGNVQQILLESSEGSVPVVTVLVRSEASVDVPYPAVASIAVAVDDDPSREQRNRVTVVFSGVDVGKDWNADASELAARIVEMTR